MVKHRTVVQYLAKAKRGTIQEYLDHPEREHQLYEGLASLRDKHEGPFARQDASLDIRKAIENDNEHNQAEYRRQLSSGPRSDSEMSQSRSVVSEQSSSDIRLDTDGGIIPSRLGTNADQGIHKVLEIRCFYKGSNLNKA